MRDISELSSGTEQTKPTNPRPRNNVRSKSENQTTGTASQDQEQRPAPRRRPAPAPQANPATQTPNGNNDQQHAAPGQGRPTTPPYRNNHNNNSSQHQNNGQSQSGGPRSGNYPYNKNNNANGNTGPGGYRNNSQNSGGQRPANTGGPSGNTNPRPGGNYRPNNASSRPGGNAPAAPRERTYSSPDRPPASSNNGNSHGSQRNNGENRRNTQGQNNGGHHTGGNRSNSSPRPGTAPRPQERRVAPVKEKPTGPISLPPQIVIKDLADTLSVTPIEVIRDLINKHSIFAGINQVVDYEKAALVAKDLGFEPSPIAATDGATPRNGERQLSVNEEMMAARDQDDTIVIPPVVTIMGHVDHGKTSLLDTIRQTKVAAGEAGGITQHIGAYQVDVHGKKITFLDTPGHEAFTAMRARGAQSTHIVIIVVAADDGVMPQTREAIDHARAAKVPIIIALNKIDKANANPDRVKQQLTEMGILIEEYGGDTVCVPISAKKGDGIDELLEYILLVAEVQDIRANPNRLATGVIIEARLEKNSGVTATVLVQQGTLKMGDTIVVGTIAGKVRAMFNDRGKRIQKAPPSTPVSVLGLAEVPQAGDHLEVTSDDRTARTIAQQEAEKRKNETGPLGQVSLDTLYMQMQQGTVKELNLVLKSDVQGSLEAIKGSLSKLSEENMKVRLIHEGIGNISETDVHLASASGAIIIGFNVKADGAAQREMQREHVDIRYYEVIYKLIEDIQAALVGMLEPTYREVIDGHAEVLQTFKAGKNIIAGCKITDGKLTRSTQIRILRNKEKIFDGKISSLRRAKDDVREVLTGYECGLTLENFGAYEVGDIIEAYSQERVAPGA